MSHAHAATSRFEHFGFGVPWEEAANYAQAVRSGDQVFVSGQVSHDLDGNFIGAGDFALQADTSFANLDRVLAHFDAQRSDVVEMNIFLVDLRANFAEMGAACRRYFGDHRPASNAFGVVALAFPEQLIEVAARIILPGSRST